MRMARKRRVKAPTLLDRSVSVIGRAPAETDEDRLRRCDRQAEILGFVIRHFYYDFTTTKTVKATLDRTATIS